MTDQCQIRALILENTFLSLPRMVPHALPLLGPFVSRPGILLYRINRLQSFLCHQKWDSATRILTIPARTPILMLSGQQDEVVPAEHMKELWDIAKSRSSSQDVKASEIELGIKYSKFIEFAKGTHSKDLIDYFVPRFFIMLDDTCVQEGYWKAVADFVASLAGLQ